MQPFILKIGLCSYNVRVVNTDTTRQIKPNASVQVIVKVELLGQVSEEVSNSCTVKFTAIPVDTSL